MCDMQLFDLDDGTKFDFYLKDETTLTVVASYDTLSSLTFFMMMMMNARIEEYKKV